MITFKNLERKYIKKINKKHTNFDIKNQFCQMMIKKALKYNLTKKDYDIIYKVGKSKKTSIYPGLYHVCCIYIHPLTKAQGILINVEKILKI